ncbi:MAG: ParB/RepB/Spo0J family partition protein [Nitrospinales bacterium]
MNRKALGKGIEALIPNFESSMKEDSSSKANESVTFLPVNQIEPNKDQPRTHFDENKLQELADSILEHGIIQPVVVQKKGDFYELIVGERRWRAAKLIKFEKIPAVIRETTNKESLQLAIIENIHRHDLNPIEEARAYDRLTREYGLTQESVAKKVGKDRASVTNYLRLLKLSQPVQKDIITGRLSMGHARALLGLSSEKDILSLRKRIVDNDLSVRDVEAQVKQLNKKPKLANNKKDRKGDIFIKDLEKQIENSLGTKVEIIPGKKGGKVVVTYYDNKDLGRVCDMMLPKGSRRL